MAPIILAGPMFHMFAPEIESGVKIFNMIGRILVFFISVPILWLLSNFIIKIIENISKKKFNKIHKRIFKLIFIIIVNINMTFILNFIVNLFRIPTGLSAGISSKK